MTETYFAAAPTSKIGTEVKKKIDLYFNFMNGSGIFRRQYRAITHYFGISPNNNGDTSQIRQGGKHGQISLIKVNHIRNIGQHLLQLTTSQRPSPDPVAVNSDAKSQKQSIIARGILDYYGREKRVDRQLRDSAEFAVVGGEGYVVTTWETDTNPQMGDADSVIADKALQPGEQANGGDVRIQVLPSSEVIKDPNKSRFEDLDWIITREWSNRFKVADKWAPLMANTDDWGTSVDENPIRKAILDQNTRLTYDRTRMSLMNWMFNSNLFGQSDDIAVYSFWHKKTSSLPNGKLVLCLEDGTVILDGDLPYDSIPVRRICPADLIGSPFGYTPLFDLIVLQEAIDALYSAVATNQLTFGVQLIMAMKGSDIDFRSLARGLSFIEYSDPNGKPEPLNLTHTPKEVFDFIAQLERVMETISGVNSVVRGNVPEQQMSGSALALVQSQSIAFSTGLQQSYAHLVEDVYTDILNILKKYADNKKTITIVGKYNRSMLMSFDKSDIDTINRVVCGAKSDLEMTTAGKQTIAEHLMQMKLIRTPEEYLSVIRTGTIEPMLEGGTAENILIRSENESMANGQPVFAVPTDSHSQHIREHRAVLATPESRNDPAKIKVLSDHLQQHVQFLADPNMAGLLVILGETPLAMAGQPQPGQAQGGPVPGSPQAKQEGPPAGGQQPKQPQMPVNPANGQRGDRNGNQAPPDQNAEQAAQKVMGANGNIGQ